ncbi:hypothetical protein D3C75_811320 [compost metagenome]
MGADHHKGVVDTVGCQKRVIHHHQRAGHFSPLGVVFALPVNAALQFHFIIAPAQRCLLIIVAITLVRVGHIPAKTAVDRHRVVVVNPLRTPGIRRAFNAECGGV